MKTNESILDLIRVINSFTILWK